MFLFKGVCSVNYALEILYIAIGYLAIYEYDGRWMYPVRDVILMIANLSLIVQLFIINYKII